MRLVEILEGRRQALCVNEVANLFCLTPQHIYKMAARGALPSLRIAGAIRFDPQDLVGGGDRKEKQVNKACALSVLQPPLLPNWNKWNAARARLPWAARSF
jgi:hypothetical protein